MVNLGRGPVMDDNIAAPDAYLDNNSGPNSSQGDVIVIRYFLFVSSKIRCPFLVISLPLVTIYARCNLRFVCPENSLAKRYSHLFLTFHCHFRQQQQQHDGWGRVVQRVGFRAPRGGCPL